MEQIETAGGSEAVFELINIIRQDPSIWDRTSTTYITHFDLKIHRFAEIAEQLNLEAVTAEVVASAWRELSEKYRRRLYDGKRRNGATNWPYFEAMSFLRDQYEQTKWYRPLSVSRSNQLSSSSNVAHLVDTFLTAQAVLDAEQTISKAVEPMLPITLSDSLQQKGDTVLAIPVGNGDERKAEFTAKYELVDPTFHSFTTADQNELSGNVDVDNIAIASAADSTKSPDNYDEKQPVSPTASVDGLPQSSNNSITDQAIPLLKTRIRAQRYEAYKNPRRIWKHQKQSALHQTPGSVNNTFSSVPTGETVAEILRSVRVASDGIPSYSLNSNPHHHLQQQQHFSPPPLCDSSSRWENVGRVWVDMMKMIRSPQLALAAHKYIMNTLFSVLEADQQLIGTDPNATRIRIKDSVPQIEIIMHQ
ncbi:Alcohol dehydrogenase transcription factor Myb/SANT-like family protein [Acanthocheilonema viteae]